MYKNRFFCLFFFLISLQVLATEPVSKVGTISDIKNSDSKYYKMVVFRLTNEESGEYVKVFYEYENRGISILDRDLVKEGAKASFSGNFRPDKKRSNSDPKRTGNLFVKKIEEKKVIKSGPGQGSTSSTTQQQLIEQERIKKVRLENNIKINQERESILQRYDNKYSSKKVNPSRLVVAIRLNDTIVDLRIYLISSNIGGIVGLMQQFRKTKNSMKSYYSIVMGAIGATKECEEFYIYNQESNLTKSEISLFRNSLNCEMSDKNYKIYAISKFKENNLLDIWSINQDGILEHIKDGFVPVK